MTIVIENNITLFIVTYTCMSIRRQAICGFEFLPATLRVMRHIISIIYNENELGIYLPNNAIANRNESR